VTTPAQPDAWDLAAASLWREAKKRALKRKTLTQAEAGELLEVPADQVPKAAWPIHVWCWVRGMPPLNVVVVKRGKTADPEGGFTATDFDVFHEAMGHTVYTLEHAWFYPWEKVPDPSPEQLAWALAAHARHHDLLRDARFLDLELELRLRDESRGRKRAVPSGHATWKAVEEAHRAAFAQLKAVGFAPSDLRPPGKGPYPPPRPVKGNWAD
jgi:hypothetical protein